MNLKTARRRNPISGALTPTAIAILLFAAAGYGQNVRPAPTATPFVPEVVSRDSDLEDMIRKQTDAERVLTEDTPETVPQRRPVAGLELDSLNEEQQKRLVLYLDILTRLEQRAESLRGQLINMIEKQNSVTTKIQQVDYNLRPEVIAGITALSGSFRPEDLREQRKSELEIEKQNLTNLLDQLELSIATLEDNLRRADMMAERVRLAFEAMLESALTVREPL